MRKTIKSIVFILVSVLFQALPACTQTEDLAANISSDGQEILHSPTNHESVNSNKTLPITGMTCDYQAETDMLPGFRFSVPAFSALLPAKGSCTYGLLGLFGLLLLGIGVHAFAQPVSARNEIS